MKLKKYKIGEKEYQFKLNALVPLIFYNEFNIDIFSEMEKITNYVSNQEKINSNLKKQEENGEEVQYVDENLTISQQEILLKLAYVFNKNAENFDTTFDEWIENLDFIDFALMQNIAIAVWVEENQTSIELKKK